MCSLPNLAEDGDAILAETKNVRIECHYFKTRVTPHIKINCIFQASTKM